MYDEQVPAIAGGVMMKFRAHETFAMRKGWLAKGLRYVNTMSNVFVSKDQNLMDTLGIGSNMVISLRYWMQATGLSEEYRNHGSSLQRLTEFGKLVLQYDPYIEEAETLALLHYKLSSNNELATSWCFFFNCFDAVQFERDDFVLALQKYIKMDGKMSNVAIRSLTDDFDCIIRTYMQDKNALQDPESNMDCPLSELHLVANAGGRRNIFRKCSLNVQSINPWVLRSTLCEASNGKSTYGEIAFNDMLYSQCGIGRTFNFDTVSLLEALRAMEMIGELQIIRSSGIDVIRLTHSERTFTDCVLRSYTASNEEING